MRFGLQVAGPNGLSSLGTWLDSFGNTIQRDIYLINGGSLSVPPIDLAADPFGATIPPGVGLNPGPLFLDLTFTATSNFDEVLIRAEFFGGVSGNESMLFVVPEPSHAALLGLLLPMLVLRRRR